MSEPTKEELKKFWEWCGLDLKHKFEVADVGIKVCSRCGGVSPHPVFRNCKEPSLTLDNLFKYAVPKLPYVTLENCKAGYRASASADMKSNPVSYNEKPELALFRAIQEAIK